MGIVPVVACRSLAEAFRYQGNTHFDLGTILEADLVVARAILAKGNLLVGHMATVHNLVDHIAVVALVAQRTMMHHPHQEIPLIVLEQRRYCLW